MGRSLLILGVSIALVANCGSDDADGTASAGGASGAGEHDAGDSGAEAESGVSGGAGGLGGSGGTSAADASWPAGAGGSAGDSGSAGTAAGSGGNAGGAGEGTGGQDCVGQGGSGGPCSFPQGVPDPDYVCWAGEYQDTNPAVDAAVNAVMVDLSGCSAGSDCTITGFPGDTVNEICQSWFAAVTDRLRQQGYCAGQHVTGHTDEIAVSDTGCTGKWYGYHVCNYGGGKVVWNPGARRGWWMIDPSHCPP